MDGECSYVLCEPMFYFRLPVSNGFMEKDKEHIHGYLPDYKGLFFCDNLVVCRAVLRGLSVGNALSVLSALLTTTVNQTSPGGQRSKCLRFSARD